MEIPSTSGSAEEWVATIRAEMSARAPGERREPVTDFDSVSIASYSK